LKSYPVGAGNLKTFFEIILSLTVDDFLLVLKVVVAMVFAMFLCICVILGLEDLEFLFFVVFLCIGVATLGLALAWQPEGFGLAGHPRAGI
jgi:hypothetical protein